MTRLTDWFSKSTIFLYIPNSDDVCTFNDSTFMTRPKADVLLFAILLRRIFVYFSNWNSPQMHICVPFLKLKMILFYRALQTDFPTFAFPESKNDIVLIFVLLTLPCGANTCVTVRSALYERSFPALMTSSPVSTLERLAAPFIHSCKFCYCPRKILQSLLSKSLWSTVLKSSCVLMRFDIWCVHTE